ncbi:MAG: 30S ribosomal protein S17 [Legionellaceae bacterium]|nr:30S ribosomal protein S17 [Legionellaceae bacterium]
MQSKDMQSTARSVIGKVVSDKMDKTIVVLVERTIKDPKYGKYIRKSSKVHVHDEAGSATIGNMVKIQETRPISKKKTWKLVEIVS